MYLISTNITSPLGHTTEENYHAVRAGRSGIRQYEAGTRGVPFPIAAALFPEPHGFVDLCVRSAREALSHVAIDVTSPRTLYILSTTKGEIGIPPGHTAQTISRQLGITTQPVVVCNACISGVSAQVLAQRMLSSGRYDHVVLTGCDVLGPFIISGFNSLKALSPEPCRPFDMERLGLNLGEGAATMVFSREKHGATWQMVHGAIRNDAYHISGPHPQGEGSYRALMALLNHCHAEDLATIGVHGTATMYNDQMESKAIMRAGLSTIPLSALKGYYGHTLGAAGVIETILTARALDDGIILASKGFDEIGVSGKVTISHSEQTTSRRSFIKQLSGFGGCNGAVLYAKADAGTTPHTSTCERETTATCERETTSTCERETTATTELEQCATVRLTSADDLTAIYKAQIGDYPKYYKMDRLSKLAFVATELLMSEGTDEHAAVILFNRTSSCISDRHFEATISDADNYFPSPSVFVYTLPNITTGEIALRHGIHGETSFYILPAKDQAAMDHIIRVSLMDRDTTTIVAGWIDAAADDDYEIELSKYTIKKKQ